VEKHGDGSYGLTAYGGLTLRLITGQLFAAGHRDYFSAHTLRRIPDSFVSRIGELQGSRFTEDVWVTFKKVESIFRGAEEYVHMVHDQYLLDILPLGVEALRRGVTLRSVDPLSREPGRRLDGERPHYIGEEDEEYLVKSWEDGRVDARLMSSIDVFLYVSERESVLAFPLLDGSFDYVGFASTDEDTRTFCVDLFNYYWGMGLEPTREKVQDTYFARRSLHRAEKQT
jgi:predicted transcriptional regulator